MTTAELIFFGVECFGLAFFAISGVVLAGRAQLDGFGVFVIAFITAAGGGTVRDVILNVPPFWTTNMGYFWSIAIAGVLGQIMVRVSKNRLPGWVALSLDAAGLCVFSVTGCLKTLDLGWRWEIAILMAILTGVGGGLVRDTLLQVKPYVFRGELYAIISAFAAALLVAQLALDIPRFTAGAIASFSAFILRMLAWKKGWSLPVFDIDKPVRPIAKAQPLPVPPPVPVRPYGRKRTSSLVPIVPSRRLGLRMNHK
ncbi:trimeric intracellular cation channel family protein [Stomatohabitans albus]|uniref:trimeric intracellular cation channel family protein n=1 Tax=Stomatohabitans albus TaxID=3110766 RepID=UPI00300C93F6